MDYKRGYTIKPSTIRSSGIVDFTNNAGDKCVANQVTCEAYGYRWDNATKTCRAFTTAMKAGGEIIDKEDKENRTANTIAGAGNEVTKGSYNALFGQANHLKGSNINCLASGYAHTTNANLSSTRVTGQNALVQRQAEDAIGGGDWIGDGSAGQLQTSTIQANCRTAGTTPSVYWTNNARNAYIPIQPNSMIGFVVFRQSLTMVTAGEGEEGCTLGSYNYDELRYSAIVRANGQATICSAGSASICNSGMTAGTLTLEQITTTEGEVTTYGDLRFVQQGTGCDNLHHLVITIHECRSMFDL